MNALIVGTRKQAVLDHLPDTFLLIDDGDLIDLVTVPERRAVTLFDINKDSFNPVKGIDYLRAVQFVDILKAVFPEGENTLTKATFEYQLLQALANKPTTLDKLISDTKDTQYAYQKIQRLLLSPVLERVLNRPTSMSFKGTILARLDRTALSDFDCFVLANLLISQYAGPVVIPDFGFYAHKGHASLIRQNRLIAGVNTLAEVPQLAQLLLTIETKIASHATVADAQVLASYAGLPPGNGHYSQFIAGAIA
jgi:hypothetical protein